MSISKHNWVRPCQNLGKYLFFFYFLYFHLEINLYIIYLIVTSSIHVLLQLSLSKQFMHPILSHVDSNPVTGIGLWDNSPAWLQLNKSANANWHSIGPASVLYKAVSSAAHMSAAGLHHSRGFPGIPNDVMTLATLLIAQTLRCVGQEVRQGL
jgi:hypothetical protein